MNSKIYYRLQFFQQVANTKMLDHGCITRPSFVSINCCQCKQWTTRVCMGGRTDHRACGIVQDWPIQNGIIPVFVVVASLKRRSRTVHIDSAMKRT